MPLPLRTLGSTGCQVTALGLGGVCWNLVEEDDVAIGVVHRAIDLGITYLDTASGYKDSERKLGLALKDRDRDGLFVATKCIKRSGDDVKREIAQSFDDLGIETIDLINGGFVHDGSFFDVGSADVEKGGRTQNAHLSRLSKGPRKCFEGRRPG